MTISRLVTRSLRGGSVVRVNFKQSAKLLKILRDERTSTPLIVVSSPNQKRDREFIDLALALKHFRNTKPPVFLSVKTFPKGRLDTRPQVLASM